MSLPALSASRALRAGCGDAGPVRRGGARGLVPAAALAWYECYNPMLGEGEPCPGSPVGCGEGPQQAHADLRARHPHWQPPAGMAPGLQVLRQVVAPDDPRYVACEQARWLAGLGAGAAPAA